MYERETEANSFGMCHTKMSTLSIILRSWRQNGIEPKKRDRDGSKRDEEKKTIRHTQLTTPPTNLEYYICINVAFDLRID